MVISWIKLFHPHAWLCAFIGVQYPEVLAARPGGQHHALGNTKTHFAWLEIGHHHRELAFQIFRLVGGFDTGKHVAGLVTDIECQLQ